MASMDTHELINEVEKRNKAGAPLDGLREEILRHLTAFRDMPKGVAALGSFATAYGSSEANATNAVKYVAGKPENLENLAAALLVAAKGLRSKRTP